MADETYGDNRAKLLVAALRTLARRIAELEDDRLLLAAGPELLKRMGDLRSELFHYEVRSTYDTPEIAESRRIVEEAEQRIDRLNFETEVEEPWRHREE